MPQDYRLQTIHHKSPSGSTLSKYDFTYDVVGNIQTLQQQVDSGPAEAWDYRYDPADQLTQAVQRTTGPTPTILKRYAWGYDPAGNRLYEQIDEALTGWTYDSLNRLMTQYGGGSLRFTGTVDEPATVTIQGQSATVAPTGAFAGTAAVVTGSNVIAIQATDAAGNAATATYQVAVGASAKAFTFDANGNMTADGVRSYEWDARNQLRVISTGNQSTEFLYDGLQRRVRTIERNNGVIVGDTRLLWCGDEPCEVRRSSDGAVVERTFTHAREVNGVAQFFTRDHLLSVRDVTDASGSRVARQSFDPWGRMSIEGSAPGASGFTGHAPVGHGAIVAAQYRAYDPDLGRWLSPDPIGSADDLNLFRYVDNAPVTFIDRLGLAKGRPSRGYWDLVCSDTELAHCRNVCSGRGQSLQGCMVWVSRKTTWSFDDDLTVKVPVETRRVDCNCTDGHAKRTCETCDKIAILVIAIGITLWVCATRRPFVPPAPPPLPAIA